MLLHVYTYIQKQYKMEFDYDYASVGRIPDNHLLLMHDVFVWYDCPQSETTKDISHVESKVKILEMWFWYKS
jgi:hypothetical protein